MTLALEPFAEPRLELAFTARVLVGPPLELGHTQSGRRRIVPILGGELGGRLSGRVLPGGADWQVLRDDLSTELLARYTLELSDGTLVSVVNHGLRHGPPEAMRALLAGEPVDPALIYFRAAPFFEVATGPHDWLARHIFVCAGRRTPDAVEIAVWCVR